MKTIYYSDLVNELALGYNLNDDEEKALLSQDLDWVSTMEFVEGRPLLSCIVIAKPNNRQKDKFSLMPSKGFFSMAKRIGLYISGDRREFYLQERKRLYIYWKDNYHVCLDDKILDFHNENLISDKIFLKLD